MYVQACVARLHIFGCQSLKDKRAVIRSIIERVRHRFNVSIAEVDMLDHWSESGVGLAVVSNDCGHAREVLEAALLFMEADGRFEIRRIERSSH